MKIVISQPKIRIEWKFIGGRRSARDRMQQYPANFLQIEKVK